MNLSSSVVAWEQGEYLRALDTVEKKKQEATQDELDMTLLFATEKRIYLEMTQNSLQADLIDEAERYCCSCLSIDLPHALYGDQKDINFQILVVLSSKYAENQQYEKALSLITKALDIKPRNPVLCISILYYTIL